MEMLKRKCIFSPFLACSLVPLHKDACHKQLTTSLAFPPIMRDVSLQSIATDVDSSISLASSQNSCNVKTRSSLVTNVSLVNFEDPHNQLAFRGQSILATFVVRELLCLIRRDCTCKHWMTVLDTIKSEFLLTTVCVDMSQSNCSLVPFQCFSACCLCEDFCYVMRGSDHLY